MDRILRGLKSAIGYLTRSWHGELQRYQSPLLGEASIIPDILGIFVDEVAHADGVCEA